MLATSLPEHFHHKSSESLVPNLTVSQTDQAQATTKSRPPESLARKAAKSLCERPESKNVSKKGQTGSDRFFCGK